MTGLGLLDLAFLAVATNGPMWNPTNLTPAPMLWYIADTIASTNNAPVSLWTNNGASTNTLIQATAAQQPVAQSNFLNGHYVVLFDPTVTARRLSLASGAASIPLQRACCFTVVRPRAYNSFSGGYSAGNIFGCGHGGSTTDLSVGFGHDVSDGQNKFVTWSEKSGINYDVATTTLGGTLDQKNTNWLILDSITDGTSSFTRLYSSTNTYTSGTVTSSDTVNLQDSFLGHEPNFGSAINAYVGEFMLYSNTVASTNIFKIEGYYAWKYGLQTNLPPDHPYRFFYPTP